MSCTVTFCAFGLLTSYPAPVSYQVSYDGNYIPAPLMFRPDLEYVNNPASYDKFAHHYNTNYGSEGEPPAPPAEFFQAMMAEMFGM